MVPSDIKNRTKILGQACIKLALLLPNAVLARHISGELLASASALATRSRTLMMGQSGASFSQNITDCMHSADACAFWLEFVIEEKMMDTGLVRPLYEECIQLVTLFAEAQKKVKEKLD